MSNRKLLISEKKPIKRFISSKVCEINDCKLEIENNSNKNQTNILITKFN